MNLVKTFFSVLWPTISKRNIIRYKIIQICTLKNDITLLRNAESLKVHIHTYILLYYSTAFFYSLYLFSGYPETTKYNERRNLGK